MRAEPPRAAVLDASAVLALVHEEPGSDTVAAVLDRSVLSAVNLSEVLAKLSDRDKDETRALAALVRAGVRVEPFTEEDARAAARLRPITRRANVSLADRACLALAQRLDLPAYTADAAWGTLPLSVRVVLIR